MIEKKFFDAHTHLNMSFDNDWQDAGNRALDNGVQFINVGADAESSQKALEQANYFPDGVWASVGIHPTENDINFSTIPSLALDAKVRAIGECGLEYFRLKDETDKIRQKDLFVKHIELAIELNKPLIVHCRDAYQDVLEILKYHKQEVGDKLNFDMHFFAGDWETAQKFLSLGGYLSFTGVITFSEQYNEVIKNSPLAQIMSETDAPFVAPIPFRGQRNEPAYVEYVAKKISLLRREDELAVLEALYENGQRFFNLN